MNFLRKRVTPLLGVLGLSIALQASTLVASVSFPVITGASGPAGSKNGIAFNKEVATDTNIYGVSTVDGRIYVVDSQTGNQVKVFGPELGILGPDDLVVTTDEYTGNTIIYYTDTLGFFVGKIDTVANTMTPLNDPKTDPLILINGIALSDNQKHLYAAQCFAPGTNNLYDFDLTQPQGTPPSIIDVGNFGPSCALNGMTYQGGYLYGAQTITGDIYSVGPLNNPNSTPTLSSVVEGAVNPSQCTGNHRYFGSPAAVKFDSDGVLWIIDALNNHLSKVTNAHQQCQTPVFAAQLPGGSSVDNLAINMNVKVGKKGINPLYVSSLADGYIVEMNQSNGTVVNYTETAGLVLPLGVAWMGNDTVLVGDYSTLRVVDTQSQEVVNSEYETVPGFLGNGICSPYTVAPMNTPNLVVLGDWLEHRVQIFDYVNNVALYNLNLPENIFPINAVSYPLFGPGVVVVQFDTLSNNTSLVWYSQDFTNSQVFVPETPGFFTGLTSDGINIYIAEYFSGFIFQLNPYLQEFEPLPVAPCVGPQGLGLDLLAGVLYVVETGAHQLSAIDLTAFTKTVVESNIGVGAVNPAVALFLLSSVTVDQDTGDVYYTATAARELRKIPVGILMTRKQQEQVSTQESPKVECPQVECPPQIACPLASKIAAITPGRISSRFLPSQDYVSEVLDAPATPTGDIVIQPLNVRQKFYPGISGLKFRSGNN